MAIHDRRRREREAMRAKILDAARELFAVRGYEAVTMRQIAGRIEYSATTLYTHFADKEALLRALCDEDFLALRQVFERIARIADPIDRLRRIGMAYVEFGLEHPNHYRLMFMTPHPPQAPEQSAIERGNPEQDAYAFLLATVTDGLAAGRFRAEYRDPELLAQVLWSDVHGLVALHLAKRNDPWFNWRPIRKTARLALDAMLRGLTREG